jgi:hypothetical protein
MYGKHFESMYKGSMVGQGALFFAVWGYVIAHMKPDATVGAQVEINPKIVATIIGEEEANIEKVIERMCSPDPKSRSPEEEGRKLVRLGPFDFRVVNGKKYIEIKTEEDRRAQNRERQAKHRAEQKEKEAKKAFKKSKPLAGEVAAQKMADSGATQKQIDALSDAALPEPPEFPGD